MQDTSPRLIDTEKQGSFARKKRRAANSRMGYIDLQMIIEVELDQA
jgi:hypothetical protein